MFSASIIGIFIIPEKNPYYWREVIGFIFIYFQVKTKDMMYFPIAAAKLIVVRHYRFRKNMKASSEHIELIYS